MSNVNTTAYERYQAGDRSRAAELAVADEMEADGHLAAAADWRNRHQPVDTMTTMGHPVVVCAHNGTERWPCGLIRDHEAAGPQR